MFDDEIAIAAFRILSEKPTEIARGKIRSRFLARFLLRVKAVTIVVFEPDAPASMLNWWDDWKPGIAGSCRHMPDRQIARVYT